MKIIKKGTFNKQGNPKGWHFDCDCNSITPCPYTLNIDSVTGGEFPILHIQNADDPYSPVLLRGVEMVEWTDERRKAMTEA